MDDDVEIMDGAGNIIQRFAPKVSIASDGIKDKSGRHWDGVIATCSDLTVQLDAAVTGLAYHGIECARGIEQALDLGTSHCVHVG